MYDEYIIECYANELDEPTAFKDFYESLNEIKECVQQAR